MKTESGIFGGTNRFQSGIPT